MYALIDEEAGGIIGYFMTEADAEHVAGVLNLSCERGRDTLPPTPRYYVHISMDEGNYADLLKSIADSLAQRPTLSGGEGAAEYLKWSANLLGQ